ncbi:MAG: selenide, water dikinase SelD [Rhodospirillales bacterium]
MRKTSVPIVKDLVLIGGGHAHVSVLRSFGMKPIPGVRLTLICRDRHAPYSGMLPGLIAGHYGFDDAHIDLEPLARFAGARFYHDEATGLDLADKRIRCRSRPDVPYDVLSIDIGSTPAMKDVPGAGGVVVPVKPIDRFSERWRAIRERVTERTGPSRIGIVGAGAGGVELLLSVQYRLEGMLRAAGRERDAPEFHLFAATPELLPTYSEKVQEKFRRILGERGVYVHAGSRVTRVSPGRVTTENGHAFDLDEILWVTHAGAAPWPGEAGLAVDPDGFIRVNDCLQSVSHEFVFAAGDIAAVIDHPRPRSGVFAVRQGKPLTRNLRRAVLGKPLKPFVPQRRFLSLISTGNPYAVASRSGWTMEGAWVWHWKDWIDRRFMRRFNELPAMDEDEAPDLAPGLAGPEAIKEISALAMRCGGCGAKVGASALERALGSLEPLEREDVLVGLNAPDDAAVVAVPPGKVLVQTVDQFRTFIDDPYVFGQIAANHALGDLYAMGAEPQTALALASVPFGLEDKVIEDLTQMLSGALLVLNEAGAALIGGHTSEGAELSLGFAVNGLAERDKVLRKGGLRPGDCLILTKPLGTGALFAADMRAKAKGRWIENALRHMLQSNRAGAQVLLDHGASACTDVTGFGLLGHLVEMTKASGTDAVIDLVRVPLMDGAEETVRAGIFSSLQPQNVRLRRAIKNGSDFPDDPHVALLFDPQTAGGLLAGVPEGRAEACIAALNKLGYASAAVIGTVQPQGDHLEPIVLRR